VLRRSKTGHLKYTRIYNNMCVCVCVCVCVCIIHIFYVYYIYNISLYIYYLYVCVCVCILYILYVYYVYIISLSLYILSLFTYYIYIYCDLPAVMLNQTPASLGGLGQCRRCSHRAICPPVSTISTKYIRLRPSATIV
jgi:hypothetical protein